MTDASLTPEIFGDGPRPEPSQNLRVVDDDLDTVSVRIGLTVIREYHYDDEPARRLRIALAREFVEGWYQARAKAFEEDAKVADRYIGRGLLPPSGWDEDEAEWWAIGRDDAAGAIASAIRTLAKEPKP